ncbi:hypothetical protein D3C81_1517360 [compost metagenome]
MPLGEPLVLAVGRQAAKVSVAANFQYLHPPLDQADHWQKTFVVQRVGQQPFRCVVRRHQQEYPTLEQRGEQPGEQHGITNVMHMEFVETQYPALAQQLVQGCPQRVVQRPVAVHALVQAGKEIMEVQAPLGLYRYGLEKTVEQPAFATTD